MSRRIAPIPEGAVEALAILHRECFPDDPWEAGGSRRIMALSGGFGWIAWEEEDPAAFILVRDLGNECEILSLGVAPRWRRRGVARDLLATTTGESVRRGLPSIVLEVAVDNEPAHDLYVTAGFIAVGRRARYYRRPAGRVDGFDLAAQSAAPLTAKLICSARILAQFRGCSDRQLKIAKRVTRFDK